MTQCNDTSRIRTVVREARVEHLPGGGKIFREPGVEPHVFVRGDARVPLIFRPSGVETVHPLPRVDVVDGQEVA